jgi:hypothetical protein
MDNLLAGKSDPPCLKQDQVPLLLSSAARRMTNPSENHSGHVNKDSGPGHFLHPLAPGIAIHITPESLFTSLRNVYSHRPEYAFMAFSHGSKDGQKFIVAFTLVLVLGGIMPEFTVPLWVVLLCGGVLAVGTAVGGWRIVRTMGVRLTALEPVQGFAAETAAATTIELATRLGVPLSTTHTISTAIMGVGATRRLSPVRWGVTLQLVAAWVLTFPVCCAIASLVAKLAQLGIAQP